MMELVGRVTDREIRTHPRRTVSTHPRTPPLTRRYNSIISLYSTSIFASIIAIPYHRTSPLQGRRIAASRSSHSHILPYAQLQVPQPARACIVPLKIVTRGILLDLNVLHTMSGLYADCLVSETLSNGLYSSDILEVF